MKKRYRSVAIVFLVASLAAIVAEANDVDLVVVEEVVGRNP